jgi:hypothetical protein
MKKYFICLANSKKYGERCVAGIEVTKNEGSGYSIVKNDNKPKWIRPVTGEEHGQVPSDLVGTINLLDVVEIDEIEEVPNGYQSENIKFKSSSLKVVGKIGLTPDNLDLLSDNQQFNLFGNRGKAIPLDTIGTISKSLTLIKVSAATVYIRKDFGKEQYRLKFTFKSAEYDLPITDVKFLEKCISGNSITMNEPIIDDIYLAISLGVEHEGWYYKLVAGIIHDL